MSKSQLFGSADLSLSNGWQTHCPKTNLNKYFKSEPVTPSADETEYAQFFTTNCTAFLASATILTGSICMRRFVYNFEGEVN